MFIKKTASFDEELVKNFGIILQANYDEQTEVSKLDKVLDLLEGSCDLLEGDEKYAKVCKKINKAIVIVETVSGKEKMETNEDVKSEEYEKKELDQVAKLQKAVAQLSEACELLEDDEKFEKACKKITKAIKLIAKVSDIETQEITSSEEAEKEVQEEVEEQTDE